MILNVLNLCYGDFEEVVAGTKEREACNLMGEVVSVEMHAVEFEEIKKTFYIVRVHLRYGADPVVQFEDKAKAQYFYDTIAAAIHMNESYLRMDALGFGAI